VCEGEIVVQRIIFVCRHYKTVEDMKQELAMISTVRRPLSLLFHSVHTQLLLTRLIL